MSSFFNDSFAAGVCCGLGFGIILGLAIALAFTLNKKLENRSNLAYESNRFEVTRLVIDDRRYLLLESKKSSEAAQLIPVPNDVEESD